MELFIFEVIKFKANHFFLAVTVFNYVGGNAQIQRVVYLVPSIRTRAMRKLNENQLLYLGKSLCRRSADGSRRPGL